RRHTRSLRDWSSDVCSSDLYRNAGVCTQKIFDGKEIRKGHTEDHFHITFHFGIYHTQDLGSKYIGFVEGLVHLPVSSYNFLAHRSEERRVGKECIYRFAPD